MLPMFGQGKGISSVACLIYLMAFWSPNCVESLASNDAVNQTRSLPTSDDIDTGDCSQTDKIFDQRFPPPPLFLVPPPPPVALTDGTTHYVWRLVAVPTAQADSCNFHDSSQMSTSSNQTTGRHQRKKLGHRRKHRKNRTLPMKLSNVSELSNQVCGCEPCVCGRLSDMGKNSGKNRGLPGPRGPPGQRGTPGRRGNDGVPGLVVFSNAAAMHAVSLEGLIAYRTDVKQLFLRDHETWKSIRVSKCGDGLVDRDTGEQCDDGNDDPHDDCVNCRNSFCGDGLHNPRTEECDGRDFGEKSCATYQPEMTGSLTCTLDCRVNYDRCRHRGV